MRHEPHLATARTDARHGTQRRRDLVPVLELGGVDRLQEARLLPARKLVEAGTHHVGLVAGAHLGEGLVFIGEDGDVGLFLVLLFVFGDEGRIHVILPLEERHRPACQSGLDSGQALRRHQQNRGTNADRGGAQNPSKHGQPLHSLIGRNGTVRAGILQISW